jgi:thioesterase domain-containing protein
MRNLGPACEEDLRLAGITTAQQLIDLGAEVAFLKMLEAKKKAGRSTKSSNASYLYAIYAAIHELDWREVPEDKKREFKQLAAELRESGRFS